MAPFTEATIPYESSDGFFARLRRTQNDRCENCLNEDLKKRKGRLDFESDTAASFCPSSINRQREHQRSIKMDIKKRRQSCLCLLSCKVLFKELISQQVQQVQRQQQVQQVQQEQQVQRQQQVRQVQQEQQPGLPASALRPELQEPSVRSRRKKLSSRGRGKRKVFSWFQCIWVFE